MSNFENTAACSFCHQPIKTTDYFCANCGKNLKPAPPSTSWSSQIALYLESLLLPPYGIILGVRYLRQKDTKSKTVGIICIVITIVIVYLAILFTNNFINSFNQQFNSQLQNYQGF